MYPDCLPSFHKKYGKKFRGNQYLQAKFFIGMMSFIFNIFSNCDTVKLFCIDVLNPIVLFVVL